MAQRVALAHRVEVLGMKGLERVNLGPEFLVAHHTVMRRVIAGGNRRAVHLRDAGINRVVILEPDAVMREFEQRRRIGFGDKIRPHPVPNHQHDMPRFARRH